MIGSGSWSIALAIAVALVGTGGIVFGALKYNRDEAGKIVSQQSQVLRDMQVLNDEYAEMLDRRTTERDEALAEIAKLREKHA